MAIPQLKECLDLLERHGVPQHIVAHSLKVHEVALFLAERMRSNGVKVNVPLVEAAALLHDIDKHMSFANPSVHGVKSVELLEEEGLPKVAQVVKKHMLGTILEKGSAGLESLEEKIVYYADKRVRHDSIVSIDGRFEYLLKRYGSLREESRKTIERAYPKALELEKELLGLAHCDEGLGGMNA